MTAHEPAAEDTERVPKVRLFAAVEVPEFVGARVLAALQPLRRRHRSLRWTDPEGWHLTLAFLGWVPEHWVPSVEEALAAAAADAAPFPLALSGAASSFRSGVLWADLVPQPALAALAERVDARLAPVVALPDAGRPFRPHLTLARAKGRPAEAREAAVAYEGPAAEWTVERLVLMRSHLSKAGARYQVVGAWHLGEGVDEMRDPEQTFG